MVPGYGTVNVVVPGNITVCGYRKVALRSLGTLQFPVRSMRTVPLPLRSMDTLQLPVSSQDMVTMPPRSLNTLPLPKHSLYTLQLPRRSVKKVLFPLNFLGTVRVQQLLVGMTLNPSGPLPHYRYHCGVPGPLSSLVTIPLPVRPLVTVWVLLRSVGTVPIPECSLVMLPVTLRFLGTLPVSFAFHVHGTFNAVSL